MQFDNMSPWASTGNWPMTIEYRAACQARRDIRVKLISILTPCYNERDNVRPLHEAVDAVFARLPQYRYEHVFIDNCSRDGTIEVLRQMAAETPRVKVILNARNFGADRSSYHGLLQCTGDAAIIIMADFQDPPDLIPEYLAKWAEGYEVVLGVKTESDESPLMYLIRSAYYRLLGKVSDVPLVKQATGAGLYAQEVLEVFRALDDPYPYIRGLAADIGCRVGTVAYRQPRRRRGITKNNFYALYDVAMLGITSHSKVPLRVATFLGFLLASASMFVAIVYTVLKLLFWYRYPAGIAPLLIGIFAFGSVQLFFIGVLGEYVGAIYVRVQKRPLVVERARLNFRQRADDGIGPAPSGQVATLASSRSGGGQS